MVARIRATLPETPIYFLAIKPSILRWERWPDMARANAMIRADVSSDPRLHYIDVATPLRRFESWPPQPTAIKVNADNRVVVMVARMGPSWRFPLARRVPIAGCVQGTGRTAVKGLLESATNPPGASSSCRGRVRAGSST